MFRAATRAYLPYKLAATYVTFTYLLYRFGPVEWPRRDSVYIPTLLTVYWLCTLGGFMLGIHTKLLNRRRVLSFRLAAFMYVSAIASILNVPLVLLAEFGTAVPDLGFGLGEQAKVYSTRLTAEGSTSLAALTARSLLAPLIIGGAVLGLKHYRELSRRSVLAVWIVVLAQIVLSLWRGTDKELFDLFIIYVAVTLLRRRISGRSVKRFIALLIASSILIGVFGERRSLRQGSSYVLCLDRLSTCVFADSDNAWSVLGEQPLFIAASLTIYLAQGYHGLTIAQDAEFPATMGLGSSVASRLLGSVFGSDAIDRSYQAQLTAEGWPEDSAWSTMYSEYANDLSFPGVSLIMLGLGYVWARSYRRALRGDASATVVFAMLCLAVAYSPANNQLGISVPSLVATIAWFGGFALCRMQPILRHPTPSSSTVSFRPEMNGTVRGW